MGNSSFQLATVKLIVKYFEYKHMEEQTNYHKKIC